MSDIEKRLIRAGAVLVKVNRHKVYEIGGKRFVISHGNSSGNERDRHKPMLHFLDRLEKSSKSK